MSGLLPERQAQRMIQQYDEEQILLERRVAELENLVQQDEIKQVDASRFVALVKKYRDCEELTDTMLYAFIDRIEVHEATGGRTIYRQQNIDIHFNFIGNYYPPVETVSEEERIAAIEAEQLRKKQEKGKRSEERRKQKLYALREAAQAYQRYAAAWLHVRYLQQQPAFPCFLSAQRRWFIKRGRNISWQEIQRQSPDASYGHADTHSFPIRF